VAKDHAEYDRIEREKAALLRALVQIAAASGKNERKQRATRVVARIEKLAMEPVPKFEHDQARIHGKVGSSDGGFPGAVFGAVISEITSGHYADGKDHDPPDLPLGTRSELVQACVRAMHRHPVGMWSLHYPWRRTRRSSNSEKCVTLSQSLLLDLARLLHVASARVKPADLLGDKGNLLNLPAVYCVSSTLDILLNSDPDLWTPVDLDKAAARVTEAFTGQQWSDDQLWVVARVMSGVGFGKGRTLETLLVPANPIAKQALAAIARPSAKTFVQQLQRCGLMARGKTRAPSLPKTLPLDVRDALVLRTKWKLTDSDIECGPPVKKEALASLERKLRRSLPAPLRALLAVVGSIGDRQLGGLSGFAELDTRLRTQLEEHMAEAGDAPIEDPGLGAFDVRRLLPAEHWFALGTDVGGDIYFLAMNATTRKGTNPVIRFHHDEALTARVAAHSLGEYVALLFAEALGRRETLDVTPLQSRRIPLARVSAPKAR
jgi:cell wall assembly regulator SMI1